MIVLKSEEVEAASVDSIPYKGQTKTVKGVTIQWLSKEGADDGGNPTYGLRLFKVAPDGEIPIHGHGYSQTMYILSGQFECWEFNAETDELIDKQVCGPGDSIYIPGMEPHGMKNLSSTEPGSFLCCICTLCSE